MKNKNKSITHWNLGSLYTGANDTNIDKDISAYQSAVLAFEKKYRKHSVLQLSNPKVLRTALDQYEKLCALSEGSRASYYFALRRELDAKDDEAEKRLNVLGDILTKLGNKLVFFDLSLGKISKTDQVRLLNDKALAKYRYHLSELFQDAKYYLTEPEEKILSLKSNSSYGLWVSGTEKILNRKTVLHKGKNIPIAEAFERVSELGKKDRNILWGKAMDICKSLGEVAENEITAIVLDKKVNDELRGYAKPYSATVRSNENTDASVEALVQAVKANYKIAHRFYALKAKMLKEKTLSYADRNAAVGAEPEITFEQSTTTLQNVFQNVNPEYKNILDKMVKDRQIDVFPKTGKTGGAFCASLINLPTYVLLNFTPKMRSVMTYAHEMGHAIHAERSKIQPPLYQGHSTAVAETASTLFEGLMFDYTLESFNKKEKIVALHNRIQDDISTIIRQTAFFEFEREMHETIRKNGAMNHIELATLMQKHLKSYLGPKVNVTLEDGYTFVYVSHFRRFFYVYTYTYGLLVSSAIAERFKANNSYREEIEQFLTAGCSKSPDDIFKEIGIDVTNPKFFEAGLLKLTQRIDALEALLRDR